MDNRLARFAWRAKSTCCFAARKKSVRMDLLTCPPPNSPAKYVDEKDQPKLALPGRDLLAPTLI
jgi:hypothetical protein